MVFANLKNDGLFEMTDETYGPDKLTIEQMHTNRTNANAAGHSYYFTGKVCKWGHIAPRMFTSGNCAECHLVEVKKRYYRNRHSPRRVMTVEEKAEKIRAYYQTNREELLQKAKEYREANKEKIKILKQQYWKKNKDKLTQDHREWVQANPERERARGRARYKKNREESIARFMEYYQENREIILEKKKEYRKQNKEKISQQNKEYYLRKKKAKLQEELLPKDL